MPLYTYACAEHGEFSAWNSMSRSDAPQPCPTCAAAAPRALARPATLGGRESGGSPAGDMAACGSGMCASEAPSMGGHMCGAGCVH